MKIEHIVCSKENAVFVMEVPVSKHNRPEAKEVKLREIENLKDYETFELVDDVGLECIGCC